jgi:hypothetical protein
LLSAQANAPLTRTTAAATLFSLNSLTLFLRSHNLKNSLRRHDHLCDFYPKYHRELNFIEQYWGAAKHRFHTAGRGATIDAMKKKVLACLDDIPLDQICW